ncbi:MAG: hypothetical protein KF805_09190 [Phycisphaeraceae bacterium]|nr:hypothetical protein [Phycisphaeraceae bacterium]
MKKFILSVPSIVLFLALGGLVAGCATSGKCDDSANCCGGKSECCESDGNCKDGDAHKAENKATPAAAPAAQSAAPVNKTCPIGGHDADPAQTVSYQGKTIAFCCDDCKQEFLGMSDQGKSDILAKATGN